VFTFHLTLCLTVSSSFLYTPCAQGPVQVHGFWSDIVVSPYISFGVHTTEIKFYERAQNQYKKHSVDICEHNLKKLFGSIAPCNMVETIDGDVIEVLNEEKTECKVDPASAEPRTLEKSSSSGKIDCKNEFQNRKTSNNPNRSEQVNVRFLTGELKKMVLKKSRYEKLFDLVFVSQAHAHDCMSKDLNHVASEGSVVIAETVKYLPVKLQQKKLYVEKLRQLGRESEWKSIDEMNIKAMERFSFPMPGEDRGHAPADESKSEKGKRTKEEMESHPECMFPFVFFKVNS